MKIMRFQRPETANWGSSFDQLWNLRDEINRFFEADNGGNGLDAFNTWAPALDVFEDKENIFVRIELPGMKKEDINISLHENTLTIAGERKNEKKYEGSQTAREERFFGRFQRSFTLPKAVEGGKVKASYKDGVLTVTLPKAAEAKPKQIQIQN